MRTDPVILAEQKAREDRVWSGKGMSETGRLAQRQITLLAKLGIGSDADDDRIRRELAEIRTRLDEIAEMHKRAAAFKEYRRHEAEYFSTKAAE